MHESSINVTHINVGGWTENNSTLRTEILKHMDSDVICINETHLQGNATIELQNYTYYGFNRQLTHIHAPKGSGGIGIFVKDKLLSTFNVSVFDKSYDGILGISLISKNTDYSLAIFATYLPPESSSWGRDATAFYAHLLGEIYMLNDFDSIIICGDMNSRIGQLSDSISMLDEIPQRSALDKTTNQHGHTFIEFLNDAKFCVLNGRLCTENDNFTSVSIRGKAVVDYVCVPHDCFKNCSNFRVISPESLVHKYQLQHLLGTRSKLPDHYFLSFDFTYSYSAQISDDCHNQPIQDHPHEPFIARRYKMNRMPPNFMQSDVSRSALLELINKIESCRETQNNVDSVYDSFCDTVIHEMNDTIPYLDCTRQVRKRFKSFKPYWNESLDQHWNEMRLKERAFVKCNGTRERRSSLRQQFLTCKDKFDKLLRSTERAYRRGLMINIETECTNNPKEFWEHLKNLGPKRKQNIPTAVYDENGNVQTDRNFVNHTWSRDFSNLYNTQDQTEFDSKFYDEMLQHKRLLEDNLNDPLYEQSPTLNSQISRGEVEKVVHCAKNGKSVGFDKIPYEVLKAQPVIDYLHSLFNLCLDSGLIPSIWRKAIITPLPKDNTKDPRIPLHYRGISLLCAVSKLYSSVLNNRLLPYLENNGLLVDEQNGFRSDRSCQDHAFTACIIIKDRLAQKKSTFSTFNDLQKAFDYVDRDALLYKLLINKVDGKFYNSVRAMYTGTEASVKLNNSLTNWFPCTSGVKQGDNLSPTLFALFINDLALELNSMDCGIKIDNTHICCLLYADDIMLLSENEDNMQRMLNHISIWCRKWRLRINYTKSAVIHFRNKGKNRSNYVFQVGNETIEYTTTYKYLGIVLHENFDFTVTADTLFNSGGRAFGSMISKIHNFKDIGFEAYSKLYNSCVVPVTDYCSGVWGFRNFPKSDMVQNRAIRYYLGVHRFTLILALSGDMGWTISVHRRWLNIIRLWNRLVDMDDDRLTKKVFVYGFNKNTNSTWCSEVNQS